MAKTSFALVIVVILLAVIPVGLVYVTSPTPSAPAQIALRAHNWQYLCTEGGGGWAVTATTTADGYLYTLSGGPSPETPLVVDDDLEVLVNGKTVFLDNDNVSTRDGRTIWNGAPITFVASSGDALRIRATNPGGVDSELSPLYLHVNEQFVKLSDGVPKTPSDVFVFFDETFNISIPSEIAITVPKEGQEITWSSKGFLAKGTYSGLGGGLNIYLIVHPLTTDQWRVQNAPYITKEGTWEATVYFGTKDLGADEEYELYAIITETTVEKGLIESFPPHVAKSEVRIRRIAVSPPLQQKWLYSAIMALIILLVVIFAHRRRKKRAPLSGKVKGTKENGSPKFEINITTGDIGMVKGNIGATNKPSKKCPRCGKDVSEAEKFCPECGEPLT